MTRAFSAVLSLWLVACLVLPAGAQAPASTAAGQAASEFLKSAYSSALLQARAAEIAAARDARPEAKQLAQEMTSFRAAHLQRIRALAAESAAALPKELTFEQQVLIENLAPLDFLALSRRYTELQLQALEQEIRAYEAAAGSQPLAAFTREYLPQLRQRLDQARSVAAAVGP